MPETANRILRFFSSSLGDHGPGPAPAPLRAPLPPPTTMDRSSERLMGEIADFIVSCRLAPTAHNLVIAHSAFSGEDPQLAREIGRLRLAGDPITQTWLDAQIRCDDRETAIRALIARLADALDRFAATATKARANAGDCTAELAERVDTALRMPGSLQAGDVLAMAQSVLEHSRKLETDIRASEEETRNLRQRLARAQRNAEIDHLTGLPNRRAFEAVFDRQYREAQSDIDLLCVAFCDIDHFKRVNANHGHETGDRVIRAVAETLSRLSNQQCHVSRHGGEEFVLLFRGLSKHEAREKLDALRETFSERRFVNRKTDDTIGRITFSGGVADVFAYANPRDALRAADEALYLAKKQGRNTVIAAP